MNGATPTVLSYTFMTNTGTIYFASKLCLLFSVDIITMTTRDGLYKSRSFSLCNFIKYLRHSTLFHIFQNYLNIHIFSACDFKKKKYLNKVSPVNRLTIYTFFTFSNEVW